MQWERSVEEAALSGGVRGLGVCDALRLELVPAQLPQLIEQVEALRAPLQEEIGRRAAAMGPGDARGAARLRAAQYELRLAELLRERLPPAGHSEPFVFVGPAGMIGGIARASARRAVEALAELVAAEPPRGRELRGRLAQAAEAATAWVRTFVEAQALEDFSFDPDADPDLPW
jgi:hypothetical protein